MGKFYELAPIKLGCEVRGIDLKTENRQEVIDEIKKDITEHRLLVFKDQGVISGQRHVEISKWFGELESRFYRHPESPHPDVFRVSNVAKHGCTGVGRTGWHIDGCYHPEPAPFAYSLYHIVSVSKEGNTVFAPSTELIEGLSAEKKAEWEKLWIVSDRRGGPIHPLIYSHPVTKKKVLCFHLGMKNNYLWDKGTHNERFATQEEFDRITSDIHNEFVRDGGKIQYSHKWEAGDFIISDNLAVGHEASPETQLPYCRIGLRIMHRTTVKGTPHP